MRKKHLLLLFVIFTIIFIFPLFIIKIPFQADDWNYHIGINQNSQDLKTFYEFKRLPVEGTILFYSYKLLGNIAHDLKTKQNVEIIIIKTEKDLEMSKQTISSVLNKFLFVWKNPKLEIQ